MVPWLRGRVLLGVVLLVVVGSTVVVFALRHDRVPTAPDASALGQRVLHVPVGDYVLTTKKVNGALTRADADAATVVPSAGLHDVLGKYGWNSAYRNVWTHGSDFSSAVGFRASSLKATAQTFAMRREGPCEPRRRVEYRSNRKSRASGVNRQ